MAKVILSGHIVAPAADLEAVRSALPEHIALSRAEAGNLVFEISEDPDTAGRFSLYEEFTDMAAFEHHKTRTAASPWAKVSQDMEKLFDITEESSD